MPDLSLRWLGLAALCQLLGGCGSGDTAPATPQVPIPVVVSPPPTEPPSPPPPPPPPPNPDGPPIANVAPGGVLTGVLVCAGGRFETSAEPDGGARLRNVHQLNPPKLKDNFLAIEYPAADRFTLDINGFGGTAFLPLDKSAAVSPHDHFRNGRDEFEIYRNSGMQLAFATLGRISSDDGLCFYAAGRGSSNYLVDGDYGFTGLTDGVVVRPEGAMRLFGAVARGRIYANLRTVTISIPLQARNDAFGAFQNSPAIDLGVAQATITYSSASLPVTRLEGPDGATGTITGLSFDLMGLGFVFELAYPNGDRIMGAVAADLDIVD